MRGINASHLSRSSIVKGTQRLLSEAFIPSPRNLKTIFGVDLFLVTTLDVGIVTPDFPRVYSAEVMLASAAPIVSDSRGKLC